MNYKLSSSQLISGLMFLTFPFLKVNKEDVANCLNTRFIENFKNKFYHTSLSHVIVDSASFLFLGDFEDDIGQNDFMKSFILSVIMVSALQTIFENLTERDIPCEYGMLTVSVSIGTFQIFSNYDISCLIGLIILNIAVILYSISQEQYIYLNEFIGFISGIVICILNKMYDQLFKNL